MVCFYEWEYNGYEEKHMTIYVRARPQAKYQKIEKVKEGHYGIWVKESPKEGKANEAIISAFATYFNIPKSFITIVSGLMSKSKVIEIAN